MEHFNGKTYFYATSHYEDKYMVVRCQVENDTLFFINYYSNPLLYKLNDVGL